MSAPIDLEAEAYLARYTRESDFQRTVTNALDHYGWLWVHLPQMVGNPVGLPDLLCWRQSRYLILELKIGKRPLSAGQRAWHDRAASYGVAVHTLRNTDADWDRLRGLLTEGNDR
jgi:hypothetical protein